MPLRSARPSIVCRKYRSYVIAPAETDISRRVGRSNSPDVGNSLSPPSRRRVNPIFRPRASSIVETRRETEISKNGCSRLQCEAEEAGAADSQHSASKCITRISPWWKLPFMITPSSRGFSRKFASLSERRLSHSRNYAGAAEMHTRELCKQGNHPPGLL